MWTEERKKQQSIKLTGRNQRLSPEAYAAMREKMRLAKLGKKKVFTEEHKKNISIARQAMKARLGYINTPESRVKASLKNKGRKHTEEHKLKMSLIMKGRTPKNINMIVRRGADHKWWKGGISAFRDQVRGLVQNKNWIFNVFKRDNFTCKTCGHRGYLEAHHIKEFHTILAEYEIKTIDQALSCFALWDVGNGITLCRDCHKKIHSKVI